MAIEKYTITRHGIFRKTYKIYKGKKKIYDVNTSWFLKGLNFTNLDGKEVLEIKRPFSLFAINFELIINGDVRANIYKKTSLKEKLEIESVAGLYFIEGNIWTNSYDIENANEVIAKVAKKRFNNPRYGVAIAQGQDDLFILGLVMTIELLSRVKKARRSGK